jgi:thiol-disulfide isomerase/thioredoxin
LLLAGCGSSTTATVAAPTFSAPIAAEVQSSATPEIARDFMLQTLDGTTLNLRELRGQWVILNFWATWCAPCVKEMPYLTQLAKEREVQVLGVNFNEDAETARRFVSEHGISFPILLQPDDITLLVYGVRALPRTFVIDPSGALVQTIVGQIDPARFDDWLNEQGIPRKKFEGNSTAGES